MVGCSAVAKRLPAHLHICKVFKVFQCFCQKAKHKGSKALVNVSSFDSCKSIVEAAEAQGDDAFLISIRDVDLIAVDAKYHRAC